MSKELKFGEPFAFRLVPEQGADGERIAAEQQQSAADKAEADKQQTAFQFGS